MNDVLTITVRREPGYVIVAVTGEIDISTVTALRERLVELTESGQPLILDLDRITFIDSTGLGALVGAARRAETHGGSLRAVCAEPRTRKLLWLTGVDRRIPLEGTLDEALKSVAASRNGLGRRPEEGDADLGPASPRARPGGRPEGRAPPRSYLIRTLVVL